MYLRFRAFEKAELHARDGSIGVIRNFFFDDHDWVVRYLVADTGTWLRDQLVLIAPASVERVDPDNGNVHVNLTKERVEKSPPVDASKPISRHAEEQLAGYYAWPMYWGPAGYFHNPVRVRPPSPEAPEEPDEEFPKGTRLQTDKDPNLRSADEVRGYQIAASDDTIGHVEDYLIRPDDWCVAYLEIDTGTWLPGKKVLISPRWISWISWDDSQVGVELLRDTIKSSPEYDPSQPLAGAYLDQLHEHYGYPKCDLPEGGQGT